MNGQPRLRTVHFMLGQPQHNKAPLALMKIGPLNTKRQWFQIEFIPNISELEKKPWQYIGSGSVKVKVPGYSYMTEEEVRNSTRPHGQYSFDCPTYSQTTAYEQDMA